MRSDVDPSMSKQLHNRDREHRNREEYETPGRMLNVYELMEKHSCPSEMR
jgi:hypothetical protein